MKKIIIIGAGPVGSYISYLLSEKGYNVEVYEEHESIGKPVQCTGIITSAINELIEIPKDVIANEINSITINSLNNSTEIDVNDKVVFRDKFDQFMAKRAKEVRFFLGYKFIGIEGKEAVFMRGKFKEKVKFDFLIGSDGVNSKVRTIINKNDIKKRIAVQAIIKGNVDRMMDRAFMYDTYFAKELDGLFGWIVPESKDTLRVGVVAKAEGKKRFDWFYSNIVKNNLKQRGVKSHQIIQWQGGLIPLYDPNLLVVKGNIAIVGDSATHVKATTYGGIVLGMKAAIEISRYVDDSLKNGISSRIINSTLDVHKELALHLRIGRIMEKFSDKDLDRLVEFLNEDAIRDILLKVPRDDMDSIAFVHLYPFLKPKYWPLGIKAIF